MFHLLPLHRLSLRILVFMIARHNSADTCTKKLNGKGSTKKVNTFVWGGHPPTPLYKPKSFFCLLKGNSMFFFLLWNLSLCTNFRCCTRSRLSRSVSIGVRWSQTTQERLRRERLSTTQHNTTGRGSVQHITLVTKTQTQNLDQWTLKPKHNIYIGFGGALLRRTLTNSEILLHTVK